MNAQERREAGIIAEIGAHETAILIEHERGPYLLKFLNPYDSLVEVMERVTKLEARGYEFDRPEWIKDEKGNRIGISVRELTGAL